MDDNYISEEDKVQNALQVLREHALQRRGDSFDIGELTESPQEQDMFVRIMQNPRQLAEMFNLDEKQAQNLKSLAIGGGTGGIHRLLSRELGDVPSAVIGSLLSSWLTGKIFGK